MRRPRIPPRPSSIVGRAPGPFLLQPKPHHLPGARPGPLPLPPQNAAQLPSNPLVELLEDCFDLSQSEVPHPADRRLIHRGDHFRKGAPSASGAELSPVALLALSCFLGR